MTDCKTCAHVDVCHMHECCNDCETEVAETGCKNYATKNSEKENMLLEAYRHIGDTVYSTIFNVPGEEPRLSSSKICYIEAFSDSIDLLDEYGSLIADIEDVGKWKNDLFSSFSCSDVEAEIEKWWKKNLGIE